MRLASAVVASATLLSASLAQQQQTQTGTIPFDIEGTWSTKSNKTLTGPDFYDPVNDRLIEPSLTGISYSFTRDGHFESAYYRAVANPVDPSCPKAIMQWQHGTFLRLGNGSLILTPIANDGRQLFSNPCQTKNSIYTRYNQSELYQRYTVYVDPYHNIPRLDMFKFDGSPMNPMFIAYKPPMMLPTTTLRPSQPTATGSSKQKRSIDGAEDVSSWSLKLQDSSTSGLVHHINADRLWWLGLAMTGVGTVIYLGPRRLGIQL